MVPNVSRCAGLHRPGLYYEVFTMTELEAKKAWTVDEVEAFLNRTARKEPKYLKYIEKKKGSLFKFWSRVNRYMRKIPGRWRTKKTAFKYEQFLTPDEKK